MGSIPVLYDGRSLIEAPDSPAALHLLALLANLPAAVDPHLALPAPAPAWLGVGEAIHLHVAPDPGDRWRWEQRLIPGLAQSVGARLVHLTQSSPALFGNIPTVVSPAAGLARRGDGLRNRLRSAMAQGGMSRLQGLLWPDDLPDPDNPIPILRLPPMVHPDFHPQAPAVMPPPPDLAFPDSYILAQGPLGRPDLRTLLNAWSWGSGAIGQLYPLIILGADQATRAHMKRLLPEYGFEQTILIAPPLPPQTVVWMYRHCAAVIQPGPPLPWGGAVRHALASGRPLVSIEGPLADAMVGPAGYLIPAADTRHLGAALITTIVEAEVAERLTQAARQRAAGWWAGDFAPRLLEAYEKAKYD